MAMLILCKLMRQIVELIGVCATAQWKACQVLTAGHRRRLRLRSCKDSCKVIMGVSSRQYRYVTYASASCARFLKDLNNQFHDGGDISFHEMVTNVVPVEEATPI